MLALELNTPSYSNGRQMLAEAVILLLQPLHVFQGGYLEEIGHWNGETEDQLFRRLQGRSPSVLVFAHHADFQSHRSTRRTHGRKRVRIELFVSSMHMASQEAQLHGDHFKAIAGQDPGTYQILEDIERILYGAETGVFGAQQLIPRTEQIEDQEGDLTIWRAVYSVEIDAFRAGPDLGPLLTEIRSRHILTEAVDDEDHQFPDADSEL